MTQSAEVEELISGTSATKGETYEADVPDTLDLVDRAELALNGISGSLDPEEGYSMFFKILYRSQPPYMLHWGAWDAGCDTKYGESFPLLRAMSGSATGSVEEEGLSRTLVERLSREDGLYWCTGTQPWHSLGHTGYGTTDEDISDVAADGRMLRTLVTWRERDRDERWDDAIRRLVKGLEQISIPNGDYSFYPDSGLASAFNYPRSGWPSTREPMSEREGGEGSVLCYHGHQIQGLARWAAQSGDEQALTFAKQLATFCLLPRFWGANPEQLLVAGSEQGHVDSHVHGRAVGLRGLLEYAIVANDDQIKEFVRRSYEYLRTLAIPRLGYVSCFGPGRFAEYCESCAVGDWVALGIRLSDAGVADYWDDVDQAVRNHLVECQLVRRDLLENVAESGFPRPAQSPWAQWVSGYEPVTIHPGQEITDDVIGRTLGVFGWGSTPTSFPNCLSMACCTANASQGLYYAWESTVRAADRTHVQVNLLLNRASRWLDVESHLPYEGKVILRNKTAERIAVRIPVWVDRAKTSVEVDGEKRRPAWVGNYILVDGVAPHAVVTIEFPVPDRTVSYTWLAGLWRQETSFECRFRGSTLVDINPRDERPGGYPLYQRDHLTRATDTPRRRRSRFVATTEITGW